MADPGFLFGGQVERQRREYRGTAGAEGVGFGRGCPLPRGSGTVPLLRTFLDFLPRNGAFCVHSDTIMIRQFTTPVLIRLKPAKSSDVVTIPCRVVIRLCFSGIGLSVCKQD